MMKYELVVIFTPDLAEDKIKELIEVLKKCVLDLKGKVFQVDSWGKKNLAYKIKKQSIGVYVRFVLSLEGKKLPELEKKIRLEGNIIRYLIVKKEVEKGGGRGIKSQTDHNQVVVRSGKPKA